VSGARDGDGAQVGSEVDEGRLAAWLPGHLGRRGGAGARWVLADHGPA